MGCLLAEAASGQPLFPGESDVDQLHLIMRCLGPLGPRMGEIARHNPLLCGVELLVEPEAESLSARLASMHVTDPVLVDTICRCLRYEPLQRATAGELLHCAFIADIDMTFGGPGGEFATALASDARDNVLGRALRAAQQQQQVVPLHSQQQDQLYQHKQQHLQEQLRQPQDSQKQRKHNHNPEAGDLDCERILPVVVPLHQLVQLAVPQVTTTTRVAPAVLATQTSTHIASHAGDATTSIVVERTALPYDAVIAATTSSDNHGIAHNAAVPISVTQIQLHKQQNQPHAAMAGDRNAFCVTADWADAAAMTTDAASGASCAGDETDAGGETSDGLSGTEFIAPARRRLGRNILSDTSRHMETSNSDSMCLGVARMPMSRRMTMARAIVFPGGGAKSKRGENAAHVITAPQIGAHNVAIVTDHTRHAIGSELSRTTIQRKGAPTASSSQVSTSHLATVAADARASAWLPGGVSRRLLATPVLGHLLYHDADAHDGTFHDGGGTRSRTLLARDILCIQSPCRQLTTPLTPTTGRTIALGRAAVAMLPLRIANDAEGGMNSIDVRTPRPPIARMQVKANTSVTIIHNAGEAYNGTGNSGFCHQLIQGGALAARQPVASLHRAALKARTVAADMACEHTVRATRNVESAVECIADRPICYPATFSDTSTSGGGGNRHSYQRHRRGSHGIPEHDSTLGAVPQLVGGDRDSLRDELASHARNRDRVRDTERRRGNRTDTSLRRIIASPPGRSAITAMVSTTATSQQASQQHQHFDAQLNVQHQHQQRYQTPTRQSPFGATTTRQSLLQAPSRSPLLRHEPAAASRSSERYAVFTQPISVAAATHIQSRVNRDIILAASAIGGMAFPRTSHGHADLQNHLQHGQVPPKLSHAQHVNIGTAQGFPPMSVPFLHHRPPAVKGW